MTHHEVKDGKLEIEQGFLYWKFETSAREDAASRPTLLFVHAGVTDYTLWDAQVAYFLDNGWHCLRFDIFGLGQSLLSETYLQCAVRTPVDHVGLVDELVNKVLPMNVKVIPIGLSVGGSLALNYTIYFPPRVAGVVVVAGGVRGIDIPNTVEENQLLEEADKRLEAGDMEGAAEMQVRIWGDGPLQPEGRMNKTLRARMLAWNRDIAAREVARKGSGAERTMRREPAPGMMLHEIDVPVAIAYGTLDETCTTGTMKHVARCIKGAELKVFETAHMVNLEKPGEFNGWLEGWLQHRFCEEGL